MYKSVYARRSLWLCSLLACMLLSSCDQLDTSYATENKKSLNGISLLYSAWQRRFAMTYQRKNNARLDDYDLLIHLVQDYDFSLTDPAIDPQMLLKKTNPSERTASQTSDQQDAEDPFVALQQSHDISQYIETWLSHGSHKQFVLILRDGNVAPQLFSEWADQYTSAAARSQDPAQREHFTTQARLFNQEALDNRYGPLLNAGQQRDYHWFQVTGNDMHSGGELSGIYNGPAPHTFFTRSDLSTKRQVTSTQQSAQCLIRHDQSCYALSIPVGENGQNRLIVLANATPLFDAALVDPHARELLAALSDYIDTWQPQKSAWLQSLQANNSSGGTAPPPNMLWQLLSKGPFNIIFIHAFLFLLAYLCWRACWLGRKQSQQQYLAEDFGRHIDALAYHLRRDKKPGAQCLLIARILRSHVNTHHRGPGHFAVSDNTTHNENPQPQINDEQEAIDYLQTCSTAAREHKPHSKT